MKYRTLTFSNINYKGYLTKFYSLYFLKITFHLSDAVKMTLILDAGNNKED